MTATDLRACEASLLQAALRLCPDFTSAAAIHRTGKCLLLQGKVGRTHVLVKHLVVLSNPWIDLFEREVLAYKAFSVRRPPIRVPRLLAADLERHLLIMEHIEAAPIAAQRYPIRSPTIVQVASILQCLQRIHSWHPPAMRVRGPQTIAPWDGRDRGGVSQVERWYRRALQKYGAARFFAPAEVRAMTRALSRSRGSTQFNHGDPLFNNVLWHRGKPVFIDWEFAGCYLPGWDLAMLWVLLQGHRRAKRVVERAVQQIDESGMPAFAINLALVLAREWKIHKSVPDALGAQRMLQIEQEWHVIRERYQEQLGL